MNAEAYWHIHHDTLIEWTYDIQERINYILAHKPADEVETRLRWLTPVAGQLPASLVKKGAACGEALAVYNKAHVAWVKADADWDKADMDWHKAYVTISEAGAALSKADGALTKSLATYLPSLETLHALEHPGCPWDGKSLIKGKLD